MLRTRNARRMGALLVTLITAALVTGFAAAAPSLDQQQLLIDSSDGTFAVGGSSEQKLAQVVTAGAAGYLNEVRMPLECSETATLTLEIHEASTEPAGTVLASSTFPGTSFPPGEPQFRSIPLATPPFIAAETQFAFVASARGDCGLAPGPIGDPYTRGNGYFDARPNPAGVWVCICRFANAPQDLPFQTFVDPACLAPKVVELMRTEAESLIASYGCKVGSVAMRFSSVSAGQVLSQSPAAGTPLASGSAIDLVVSRGLRPCVVPKVIGQKLQKARAAILRANCRLGGVRRGYSTRVAVGKVMSQQPRPGARIRARGRVNLTISRGRR